MGLRNGVLIFQRVVEYCLAGVADIAIPYVDDILIAMFGEELWETMVLQHDKDIRRTPETLKTHKLVAGITNASFLCSRSSGVATF